MRRSHEQLMKIALSRPGVRHEYDALESEFVLLKELIRARIQAGKTQAKMKKVLHKRLFHPPIH